MKKFTIKKVKSPSLTDTIKKATLKAKSLKSKDKPAKGGMFHGRYD